MRQSTKFYAVLLCAALGFSTSIQSCKDYDDDIDGLQEQIDAVNKSIESLKKDFGALAYVKDVKWDESTRTLTITPATGNPVTYKIEDADTQDGNTKYTLETKEEGGVITITLKNDKGEVVSAPTFTMPSMPEAFDASKLTFNAEDGCIYYNGVKTGVTIPKNEVEGFDENKLTITAGEKGKVVIKYGDKELGSMNSFDPNALTVGKDGVVLYYGEPTGVTLPQVTIPGLTITEVKDAAGTIIGYTIKYGENEPVNLKLISEKLQSLVFMPELYYQGIEAMSANTFFYNVQKLKHPTLDANKDQSDDAATEGDKYSITPNLVAKYHMNPSNAAVSGLKKENMFLICEDKVYTKAGENKIEITDFSASNGVLTVQAGINSGLLKDIEADGKVTTLALQVGTKGEKGDTLITSDYAAVKAMEIRNFVLADAEKGLQDFHEHNFHKTAAAAIAAEPQFKILWNDADGIDVAELVATHVDRFALESDEYVHVGLDENAATGEIKAYGLKYEYGLVGYHAGANKTSQSAHAAMKGSRLRAQATVNGQQQTWDKGEQNRSTIGRMPLVRISLIDTTTYNVVSVAYIKFKITDKEEVAPVDEVKHIASFTFSDNYTVGCTPAEYNFNLRWNQIEEGIYAALNMSKEEFENNYRLDFYAGQTMEQYTNTTIDAEKVEKRLGSVIKTQETAGGEMTEVLKWNIDQSEAYNVFSAGKTDATVIIRFVKKNANNTNHYVYVTLTWKPTTLNADPNGKILDDANTKVDFAWFKENSAEHGGFKEVHFNVEVPSNSQTCKFEQDILNVFVGKKVTISGIDVNTYESFKADNLIKEFVFVTPDEKRVQGSDNNKYELSVSKDGLTLYATLLKGNNPVGTPTPVAVLTTVNSNDAVNNYVTYQENDIAKAVLNHAGHSELGDYQTLTAKIQVNVKNGCDQKLRVENNTFDVKFLRPISINSIKEGSLIDGTDNGSPLELNKVMEFVDWRNFKFVPENLNYFKHYGVNSISISVADIMLGDKKLAAVYPGAVITYTAATAEDIQKGNFGELTWHNDGITLSSDITIHVPVNVTYKWGNFNVMIPVVVKKTIGQ